MQKTLDPDRVRTIVAGAHRHARRLEWRLRLPRGEHEDLAQDLLIDLLQRLPAFDPARGSFGAFVHVVLRNQSTRIAARIVAENRTSGGRMLSIDLPRDARDRYPLRDQIAEHESLFAWTGQAIAPRCAVELRHDLSRVLDHLSRHDRALCVGLASQSPTALAQDGLGSRSAIYRRLAELRHVLTAHGLGPAWDGSAPA